MEERRIKMEKLQLEKMKQLKQKRENAKLDREAKQRRKD